MRAITLITTGGTIEKTFDEQTGQLLNRGSIVRRMLRRLRLEDARVRVVELMSKDSLDMTEDDRAAIVHAVQAAIGDVARSDAGLRSPGTRAGAPGGVVVLHGTDTLVQTGRRIAAEIPDPPVPIVLTGAMRPYEMKGSDALQNLTEALFAVGVLPAGVYCVAHGRALRFPGVEKDRARGTFIPGSREPYAPGAMPTPLAPGETLRGQRWAVAGFGVNVALATVKLIAGMVGHSSALVADAVESMVDIVGSVVIWGGLHIARRPADRGHPYGHGKAEALAAVVVAMLIMGVGLALAINALRALLEPARPPPHAFTLLVLLIVVVVKEVMFRLVSRAARDLESGAVLLDAWHHRSDAITSLAAFLGISAAVYGGEGYAWADPAAALVAAAVILVNAGRLFLTPAHELMDARPVAIVQSSQAAAERVPGVVNVHKVAARKSGHAYWVDMHVRVDADMSVRAAHVLAHRVKDQVRAEVPAVADVLVHIEPAGPPASADSSTDYAVQASSSGGET